MGNFTKNVQYVFIFVFVALGVTSCFKMGDVRTPAAASNGSLNQISPDFSTLNADVFQPKCVSCHNSTLKSGNYDMSTYVTTMAVVSPFNPGSSLLYTRVADNSMPPGAPLSAGEIMAIYYWVQAGAANNGPSPTPVPSATPTPAPTATPRPTPTATPPPGTSPTPTPSATPTTATFTYINKNIVQPKCLGCHGQGGQSPRLASYTDVHNDLVPGNASASQFYNSLITNMPPGQKLSASDIQSVQIWINAGALNN